MSNDPFARMPELPSFSLTSSDIEDGKPLAKVHYSGLFGVPGGEDRSPQLSWSGAPAGTQGYVVMAYDPDAPTLAGFWHWAVADIPGSVGELASGAGDLSGSNLPAGAFQLRNDAGSARFIGAAPPPGHGPHRYYFVVHAIDVASLKVPKDATPTLLAFNVFSHALGRAVLMATGEQP